MIEIENLSKEYLSSQGQRQQVLSRISFTVPVGSITAVVGPSGAGKSTLAKCISLLEKLTSGRVLVNGADLSRLSGEALRRQRRAIGTVFQSAALLHRKTVWENVALPLQWLGVVQHQITAHVSQLLDSVGLANKANAYPFQLSGGQQQRVGIARALALKPSVLLADEATSGLDPQSTETIIELLKRLRDEYQLAIVLITHEMDVVRRAADSVAQIQQGQLVEFGRLDQLLLSKDSLLAEQLFPLSALPSSRPVILSLRYSHSAVALDWISLLARQGINIEILAAHLENIAGRLVGRIKVAIVATVHLPLARIIPQLETWGIDLDLLPTLQEAG